MQFFLKHFNFQHHWFLNKNKYYKLKQSYCSNIKTCVYYFSNIHKFSKWNIKLFYTSATFITIKYLFLFYINIKLKSMKVIIKNKFQHIQEQNNIQNIFVTSQTCILFIVIFILYRYIFFIFLPCYYIESLWCGQDT